MINVIYSMINVIYSLYFTIFPSSRGNREEPHLAPETGAMVKPWLVPQEVCDLCMHLSVQHNLNRHTLYSTVKTEARILAKGRVGSDGGGLPINFSLEELARLRQVAEVHAARLVVRAGISERAVTSPGGKRYLLILKNTPRRTQVLLPATVTDRVRSNILSRLEKGMPTEEADAVSSRCRSGGGCFVAAPMALPPAISSALPLVADPPPNNTIELEYERAMSSAACAAEALSVASQGYAAARTPIVISAAVSLQPRHLTSPLLTSPHVASPHPIHHPITGGRLENSSTAGGTCSLSGRDAAVGGAPASA